MLTYKHTYTHTHTHTQPVAVGTSLGAVCAVDGEVDGNIERIIVVRLWQGQVSDKNALYLVQPTLAEEKRFVQ